ncbi:dentin sialophosphoprotein-like [Liolophura sinensis]|uniref:dentin sialophosphoprotein-like n=1 Tax=Liolophura sinensis TaxID=3198878 RepID=UPI0031582A75
MDDNGNKDDEDMNNDDHDNEQGDNDGKDDSDDDTDDSNEAEDDCEMVNEAEDGKDKDAMDNGKDGLEGGSNEGGKEEENDVDKNADDGISSVSSQVQQEEVSLSFTEPLVPYSSTGQSPEQDSSQDLWSQSFTFSQPVAKQDINEYLWSTASEAMFVDTSKDQVSGIEASGSVIPMDDTTSEIEDSVPGEDVDESMPAYANDQGEVLVPVSTLGVHYRTMRRDSKIEKVRKQRKVIYLSQKDFAARKAALYKKSRKTKLK